MKDLEVYLINLDRSPQRFKVMEKRLLKLGLKFTRISAVDGKNTIFDDTQIDENKYEFCHGKYITPTEVACYISHYNTMETFLKSEKKYALILEDDIIFNDNFMDVLNVLMKQPDDWDLVKFNGAHGGGKIKYKTILPNVSLVFNLFHQSKCGAYLINKKAANSYVSKLLPMFVPIDHEYIKFWKYGIKGFSVFPFPTMEEGVESTIDYKMMKKNRKPWYKKFSVLLYKTYVAFCRMVWVFTEVLKNRFTFVKK